MQNFRESNEINILIRLIYMILNNFNRDKVYN